MKRITVSTTRRIIPAALAVVAAIATSACDSEQIGAAAVVDGDRFTVSELHDEVEQVQDLEGFDVQAAGGTDGFQRELLTRHIQHEIFLHLAEQEGIEVSEADVDNAIEEFESQSPEGDLAPAMAQNGYTEESFRAGLTDQLIAQSLMQNMGGDQAALTERVTSVGEELDIEVNPRYGSWGDQLSVTDDSGSISEPVDEPTDEGTEMPMPPPAQ